jgi:hypothetical protein
MFSDGKILHLMCVNTHSLNWIHFLLWTLIDSFVWMISFFLILADGTIIYDACATSAWWSRVTLSYTARIIWCCLFSYFIRELRRDGMWAYPQLSSYSRWGWEYSMYRCWQTTPSAFWGKLMYVSYNTDRPGSSAGHPTGALALICLWVLLTWLTYAYGMLCQDDVNPG